MIFYMNSFVQEMAFGSRYLLNVCQHWHRWALFLDNVQIISRFQHFLRNWNDACLLFSLEFWFTSVSVDLFVFMHKRIAYQAWVSTFADTTPSVIAIERNNEHCLLVVAFYCCIQAKNNTIKTSFRFRSRRRKMPLKLNSYKCVKSTES